MNYANQPTPENDNSVEVKEPVAAYYIGKVGNAVAEPYDTDPDDDWDDDYDYGAPESVTVHSYEELCQKLEEAEEDERAGRVRPLEDWWRDFQRKIENDELLEKLQQAETNRLAGARTYTIAEVSQHLTERINAKI
jgi:hypothetical protein